MVSGLDAYDVKDCGSGLCQTLHALVALLVVQLTGIGQILLSEWCLKSYSYLMDTWTGLDYIHQLVLQVAHFWSLTCTWDVIHSTVSYSVCWSSRFSQVMYETNPAVYASDGTNATRELHRLYETLPSLETKGLLSCKCENT